MEGPGSKPRAEREPICSVPPGLSKPLSPCTASPLSVASLPLGEQGPFRVMLSAGPEPHDNGYVSQGFKPDEAGDVAWLLSLPLMLLIGIAAVMVLLSRTRPRAGAAGTRTRAMAAGWRANSPVVSSAAWLLEENELGKKMGPVMFDWFAATAGLSPPRPSLPGFQPPVA